MTENELKESLKSPEGGYFFYGDEDYMKQHYVRRLRDAVLGGAMLPEMNHIKFEKDDFSLTALEDALATPPVMDEKKLIEILIPDLASMKEEEQAALRDVLATVQNSPGAVLVLTVAAGGFDPGKPKTPSAALKAYSKVIKPVEFPLQPEGKLIRWLGRHAADAGIEADTDALREMIRLCGRSMFRLSAEIDKACALARSRGEKRLTAAAVTESATRTPEDEAFALANSIMRGDAKVAADFVGRALRRGEDPIKLLANLSSVFCELAVVSHLVKHGATAADVAEKLKTHSYRAGLLVGAVRGIRTEILDRVLSMFAETEQKMKSYSVRDDSSLIRLVCIAAGVFGGGGRQWRR